MGMESSILVLLVSMTLVQGKIIASLEQTVPTVNAVAVVGGSVDLPCDVNPPSSEDRILLVLWYRDGPDTPKPICSFDARKHPLSEGRHWYDPQILGARAHFQLGGGSSGNGGGSNISRLSVADIRSGDHGVYRCRVDFKLSPTRNARVNLTVIIPPLTPMIFDESGQELKGTTGAFNEDGNLVLTCEALGGSPTPRVTWWLENRLLDAASESVLTGRVRNTLRLPNLSRSDQGMILTCQASNNNVSVPTSVAVAVEMKLRPLGLKLEGENRPFSADRKYEHTCTSWGARPPALITWWKGSTRLQSSRQAVSADGNLTTSVLTYVPTLDDDGKMLSCRVEHSLLLHSALEQGWKLAIQYVPIAQLQLGSKSLRLDDLKEGDDIVLECNVRAVPWISRVFWRLNGKQIHPNSTAGVIVHNQTLIIAKVDRRWTGLITCVASNEEGDGESNALPLHIQFTPVCKPGQVTTYYVARKELIQIPCELEAYPNAGMDFFWSFNGSRDISDIPGSTYVSDRLRSSLTYQPVTEQDYGVLMCWARNVMGEQRHPCVFHVLPAGKPDPVADCKSINISSDSVQLSCRPGYDGGLPQHFLVEVMDLKTGRRIFNRTEKSLSGPNGLSVRNLEPQKTYELTFWAVNSKGRSDPATIYVETKAEELILFPTSTEKDRGTEPKVAPNAAAPSASPSAPSEPMSLQLAPVLGSVIGICSALVISAVIIALIVRLREKNRQHRRNHRHNPTSEHDIKAAVPLHITSSAHHHDDTSVDLRFKAPKKGSISREVDDRDEDERAFDQILSMSTTKRMIAPQQKVATIKR